MKITLSALTITLLVLVSLPSSHASQAFRDAHRQTITQLAFDFFPTSSLNGWIPDRESIGGIAPDYLVLQSDGSLDVFVYKAIPKPSHLPRARQTSERISLTLPSEGFNMAVRCTSIYVDDLSSYLDEQVQNGAYTQEVLAWSLSLGGLTWRQRDEKADMLSLRCSVPKFVSSEILAQL